MAFTLQTKNRTSRSSAASTRDEDEFAGLWINVGVNTAVEGDEEGATHFNRLPRGIAVSDLKDHKVYASTNEEWASEARLVNRIMNMIREKGLTLEEGEAVDLNLSVKLYRRQEQVDQVDQTTATEDKQLEEQLFG